jgi:RNA polymerase sigma-70 factor (ECF subfamily)
LSRRATELSHDRLPRAEAWRVHPDGRPERTAVPVPIRPQRDPRPKATPEQVSDLVARAQRNDRDAFAQLYRLYYRPIYNLARFYLPKYAEDVVAETFLRAWGGIIRYRDTGRPFAAWLYAIARHVVVDELRVQHRVEPRDELPDSPWESQQDDRLMLAQVLARLPKGQRTVIELRYLLGFSHKEIAQVMRKSVGAVKAQRWRGLQNLSTMLHT